MKKLLTLVTALILVFSSCSSDDDSSSTPILLTQLIASDVSGTVTTNYIYNNTKLVEVNRTNGDYQVYTYTGDLITKIIFSEGDSTFYTESIVEYDSSEKILSVRDLYHTDSSYGIKNIYTYNTDGTVSYNRFSGDLVNQDIFLYSGKYFFGENGEVIKVENYNSDGDIVEQLNFTHDSMNSPFKNITGYNKLFPLYSVGKNFNITYESRYYNGSLSVENTTQYQYNSNNYPSSMVWSSSYGDVLNYTLVYNQ